MVVSVVDDVVDVGVVPDGACVLDRYVIQCGVGGGPEIGFNYASVFRAYECKDTRVKI